MIFYNIYVEPTKTQIKLKTSKAHSRHHMQSKTAFGHIFGIEAPALLSLATVAATALVCPVRFHRFLMAG